MLDAALPRVPYNHYLGFPMQSPFPNMSSLSARLVLLLLLVALSPAQAAVVISQVYGGGGNSGATLTNDFIELLNTGSTPVDLSGWSVQYASSSGSSWQRTNLSGTLAPGAYYLVQQAQGSGGSQPLPSADAVGTIAMSASAGKVALVSNQAALSGTCPTDNPALVDLLGFGSANCSLGSPTPSLSNTTAALRLDNGCKNTRVNADDFERVAPTPRNTASPLQACGGPLPSSPPSATAGFNPSNAVIGEFSLLTASVSPGANPDSTGLVVEADFSALGGAANQPLFDDGSHGDAVAGDRVFSYRIQVPTGASPGLKSIPLQVRDAELRSAELSAELSVVALLSIAEIQGPGQFSAFNGVVVVTEGVVTGVRSNGFYIQTPDALADADPRTSEGIFVFSGSGQVPGNVALGHMLRVQGRVTEYQPSGSPLPLTELVSPQVSVLATAQALPTPVSLPASQLGSGASADALEHLEGMRVAADRLQVVAPTLGFINERAASSSITGVFYAVLDGVGRPFREPGLEPGVDLPAPHNTPRFDGNYERLRVDSRGLGGEALMVDAGAELLDVRGVLDYAFGTWSIAPDAVNGYVLGNQPVPRRAQAPGYADISIAGFNLLRFFDDINDPSVGEPVLTSEAYAFRLAKTAHGICHYLHAPDIVGVVEVESLPVLSRLADEINASCPQAPNYVAYLEEGNDVGGIDVGFLISRREVAPGLPRVELASISQIGKNATWIQPDGSSTLLNDRPSLAIEATVNQSNGQAFALTVVANHLRSLSGANVNSANGDRVRRKRAAQARMLAEWVEQRQQTDLQQPIVLLGDFNAFEFNDGLTDVMGIITGAAAGADQVLLHETTPISRPLLNLTLSEPANQRYSFSFDGNAQTLDHMLVNQALLDRAEVHVDHARLNADFSVGRFGDASNDARVSDHDPVLALISVPQFRSADLSLRLSANQSEIAVGSRAGFRALLGNVGPGTVPAELTLQLPAAALPLQLTPTSGWSCTPAEVVAETAQVRCQHPAFAPGEASIEFSALAADALGGAALSVSGQLSSSVSDPLPGNNQAVATTNVRAAADLAVSVMGPHTPIISGRGASFEVAVSNQGPDAAWRPQLSIEASASAGRLRLTAPSGWQCQLATSTSNASRFDCQADGRMANGARAVFELFADPPRTAPQTWFVVSAEVQSTTPDGNGGNNSASDSQRVTGKPGG